MGYTLDQLVQHYKEPVRLYVNHETAGLLCQGKSHSCCASHSMNELAKELGAHVKITVYDAGYIAPTETNTDGEFHTYIPLGHILVVTETDLEVYLLEVA